jgi:uncharacterized protein
VVTATATRSPTDVITDITTEIAGTTTGDLPVLPAIVDGVVSHRRNGPVRHEFHHRVYQWLIDLDQIPRPPWYLRPVAGFDARDHLGGTGRDASTDIRTNVERFLTRRGVDLGPGGRVVMLANARVFGHVFDPLTVFWCFGSDQRLRCVVAEVHNTYGERHAYLLTPGIDGDAVVDKQFYVSPFNDVSGQYAMRFVLDDAHVDVTVSLSRDGHTVFDAGFTGRPTPATARTVARFALRMPMMPHRVSTLIRFHAIRLWLRRLPVIARPEHVSQHGV